jgi:hypothetical protein
MPGSTFVNAMINLNSRQRTEFLQEMQKAKESQDAGYEGRMRVCIRRAAGVLLQVWMDANSIQSPHRDIYRTIEYLLPMVKQDAELETILYHLVTRVNEDYSSPKDIDFFHDVHRLAILLRITVQEE